jgi:hypothetical protein
MLGEIHHVPARGITGRTGHSRRPLDWQLAHDLRVTRLQPGRPPHGKETTKPVPGSRINEYPVSGVTVQVKAHGAVLAPHRQFLHV